MTIRKPCYSRNQFSTVGNQSQYSPGICLIQTIPGSNHFSDLTFSDEGTGPQYISKKVIAFIRSTGLITRQKL